MQSPAAGTSGPAAPNPPAVLTFAPFYQLNTTHIFHQASGDATSAELRETSPQVAASVQNPQEFDLEKKIFRKNICLLPPQSAITVKSFPSAIPRSNKMVYISSQCYLYLMVKHTKLPVFFMQDNTLTDMLVYIPGHSQPKDCEKAYWYL